MRELLNSVLSGKQTVAVAGHIHPDGDSIGACIGLSLYLKKVYPEKRVDVYLEEIPKQFRFLSGADEILQEKATEEPYDLFICLDCGDAGRLGFAEEIFEEAKSTFCVDHHISNPGFAETNYVKPEASSASELVYRMLDPEQVDQDIAAALYMGIAHDTGIFFYSCTSPETMESAANLMRTGIPANEIIDRTFYVKTYVQQKLLGQAILSSELYFGEKCIASVITKEEMDRYGADPEDLEGIVSQLRNTEGVEASVFLYELPENKFKVSLRSRQYLDMSKVAMELGGGGHARAAGVTLSGEADEILKKVLAQIKEEFLKTGEAK